MTAAQEIRAARLFADAADVYWSAGWRGVLPLPPGRKKFPPKGWTGYDGPDPSYADVMAWADDNPGGNIALRMAIDQVGVDCDHYGAKRGGDTLSEYGRRAGEPLPPTWRLTSRGADSPSGRYMFRLSTPGTRLVTAIPDVELLQRHHRYAVAWPSRNGDDGGRPVQWIDPSGRVASRVPSPSELPELPASWVELLLADRARTKPLAVADSAWREWVRALEPGPPCTAVQRRVEAAEAAARERADGNRYDKTRDNVLGLMRLGEMGHHGVADAMRRLRAVYVQAVADRADERTALGEFARFHRPEALGVVLATPTPAQQRVCTCKQGLMRLIASIEDPDDRAEWAHMLGVRV